VRVPEDVRWGRAGARSNFVNHRDVYTFREIFETGADGEFDGGIDVVKIFMTVILAEC
jgi:hypothetical protein